MPKVLVYRSELLPLSETFIKEQILAYKRWQGVLIGMHAVNELPLDGLDVRVLRTNKPDYFTRLQWKFSRMRQSIPSSVVNMLRRERASLLHAHFGPNAIEAWPLARALDLPMLVTLHGYDININREWWEAGHGGAAMRKYPSDLLKLAKQPSVHFIAVSEAIRRRASSYGIPENKITVQYIGIDTSKFAPSCRPIAERERRVLFVGRLVEKKGCEGLIRAFSKVREVAPDALLVVVGDGPLRGSLQRLAQELNIPVQFRGAVTHREVQQECNLARICCVPSITAANGDAEGLPTVVMESQACGIPVITSARGAEEAVDDGHTGLIFGERDIDSLATKLHTLLVDDNLVSSMSEAGPKFISQKFAVTRCTEALESAYDGHIKANTTGV
jgi:glycosyltransferase involved in cell wall biosynthesis